MGGVEILASRVPCKASRSLAEGLRNLASSPLQRPLKSNLEGPEVLEGSYLHKGELIEATSGSTGDVHVIGLLLQCFKYREA